MRTHFHYAPVTEAIQILKKEGFNVDFNLTEKGLLDEQNNLLAEDEFKIVDVYRYEGDSDPADESTVYALEAKSGLKGILVTGYGYNSDNLPPNILKMMHY